MLLFWIFFDETQMLDSREHANHYKCFLMYLKLTIIMILNLSFCTEIPYRAVCIIQFEFFSESPKLVCKEDKKVNQNNTY